MATKTPNLALNGNIDPCETGIIGLLNENIERLDAIVNAGFIDFVATESALPVSPTSGDRYIASDTGNIHFFTTEWKSIAPQEGFRIYNKTDDKVYIYDGTSWNPDSAGAANIGAGEGIFAQINPTTGNLEFKTLVAGGGIVITSGADTLTITNSNSSFVVDPYAVQLSNPQFENDLTSWTFDPDVSDNTFTRETSDPLSGNASGQINAPETSIPAEPGSSTTTLRTDFTLAGGVQVGQRITVEFDYQIDNPPSGIGNYTADLFVRVYETTGLVLVNTFTLTGLGNNTENFVAGEPSHVCVEFEAISTATNYTFSLELNEYNLS